MLHQEQTSWLRRVHYLAADKNSLDNAARALNERLWR